MSSQGQIDTIRTDFIERMGVVAQTEGTPRMAGQIFAMLVFDGDAIAFGEIATNLAVSRATVSTSIRLLEDRGLIRRVNKRGERQDYFQLADDAYLTMMKFALSGTQRAKGEIDDAIQNLPDGTEDVRRRLSDFSGFYDAINTSLSKTMSNMPKTKP
ncbi:GbsR/MarR family transcriptional regulator [Falsihalocynthiibacter arcticus]|uniref:HTH marR-type domain-containing protein n=1 Tax=Falsihalocynthiibacter arcticus TaxID=1579316 RepID=A0A126UXZ3_9RHOB|nr:GntR family transcriptional regulator [Falsihalocynthiibacter arcticus]AML50942.1 hypothetical protein RC74_06340 [Falsihalocynthiibacter arcticus]